MRFQRFFGSKINNTRIVPITLKITLMFLIFLLLSNLITNYINITFTRIELINLMKELLVKDLKELYNHANVQNEIYKFNQDKKASIANIEKKAFSQFKNGKSFAAGIGKDGTILFKSFGTEVEIPEGVILLDSENLMEMSRKLQEENCSEGAVNFLFNGNKYIGIYKYSTKWDVFVLRAEELKEFYHGTVVIFRNIVILIFLFSLFCAVVGVFILSYLLRFVDSITRAIMKMLTEQKMEIIPLEGASNDDISFLGAAFNSLSSSINNLMGIFLKFVNRDTAMRAYQEKVIRLEGKQRELAILFSDIKSFTFMTETLGIDIIKVLNVHYERAISCVIANDGVIGSIIGDAILAVFGVFESSSESRSYHAVLAAYEIQRVTESLRKEIMDKKQEILETRDYLTEEEERIFKAVLIEVGAGIDGGQVFYGNIGSTERMANTVIGDNVNSASRLEGLTRVYKVPVICSEFIMNDILKFGRGGEFYFLELDTVQVKGKTEGKKIYYPILMEMMDEGLVKETALYRAALSSYYIGEWEIAYRLFEQCDLPQAEVFRERIKGKEVPKGWAGIWTMTTK